jgi:uncharacterized protein (TIRG00374 family)
MKQTSKKMIKLSIKIVFTILFLWWIVFKIDWLQTWGYFKAIGISQIILYLFLYFLGMAASAYKWQFLAKNKGISIPFKKFFQYYFSATFINNFMPSFVGGDAFKAYQIGQDDDKFKEGVSSVIVDRITGLCGAMALALFFTALNFSKISKNKTLLMINLAVFFGLAAFFLIMKFPKTFNFLPSRLAKFFERAIREVASYNGNSEVIAKSIALSFVFNFIGLAGANYVLFQSIGIEIAPLDYLSVIFLISVVSSVPITINNIGVKEWAYIIFFGFFGASASGVITVAILSRALQMLSSFLAWPIYLRGERSNLDKDEIFKVFSKKA